MDYSNEMSECNYKEDDIAQKFLFFNVLKDGRIDVLAPNGPDNMKIPPTDDPVTGVKIKDVMVSSDVAVRMFLPHSLPSGKLPVLLYAHGGAFCMNSAFSVEYTRSVSNYVAQAGILAVSVEYRLFPKHSISVCYEDAWTALSWIASHGDPNSEHFQSGSRRDPWISNYADLKQIYLGGDSAGATISHTVLANVRKMGLPGNAKVEGMIFVHPYFGDNDKMWLYMCPINEGPRDPRMHPAVEDLANLCCDKVLVIVGEKDVIRECGIKYVEELKKSGWNGKLVFVENKDKEHCFHISNFMDPEAIAINRRIGSFIHDE